MAPLGGFNKPGFRPDQRSALKASGRFLGGGYFQLGAVEENLERNPGTFQAASLLLLENRAKTGRRWRGGRSLLAVCSPLHTGGHLLFRAGINKNKSFMLFWGEGGGAAVVSIQEVSISAPAPRFYGPRAR